MMNILCFGDSNTYGRAPLYPYGRWPRTIRWTGLLQSLLGPDYYVIEEGYCGRTTTFLDRRDPYMSGIDALIPILKSHSPLDLIIIMLGTNDLQTHFASSARDSASSLKRIIETINGHYLSQRKDPPDILIASPILIGENIEKSIFPSYDYSSHIKSLELGKEYKKTAEEMNTLFFDCSSVASPGEDSLHLDECGHKKIAYALSKLVKDKYNF